MSHLNSLFDFTKFEKRKTAQQSEFENSNRELIIDFKNFTYTSFKNLHKKILSVIEPIDQDKNLYAVVMSGFLRGQFLRTYPHYCYKATSQRFKLFIDNTSVYIKKLDSKTKLPSNIPTDESLMIYNQLTNSESDLGCNIFLGYTVSDDWSQLLGIYATCIEGEKIIWISDLNTFGESELPPIVELKPKPITPRLKADAKKKRKRENE